MSEGMGADLFCKSGILCQWFDDTEDHNAGDIFPFTTDEYTIFEFGLDVHGVTVDEVEF